jgi:hypothetical protein
MGDLEPAADTQQEKKRNGREYATKPRNPERRYAPHDEEYALANW